MDRDSISNESKDFPRELTGRTPRRVRMTWLGWANVFIAVFFLLVGVAFGVGLVRRVLRETGVQSALRQNGSNSPGQITDVWRTTGKLTGWYVSYSFEVNGAIYSGSANVPKQIWSSLRKYDPLTIRYLIADANINHPAAWEDASTSEWWMLFFPVAMAIFGVLFIRRVPGQRRIAVEGAAARGCISDCQGPFRSGFALDYTFKNANSGELEVGSCRSDRSREVGSDVWVLYLPSDPSRSEIYPFNTDFFRIE